MIKTSDPRHPANWPYMDREKKPVQKASTPDPKVRRRIEDILEQRAIEKSFEL